MALVNAGKHQNALKQPFRASILKFAFGTRMVVRIKQPGIEPTMDVGTSVAVSQPSYLLSAKKRILQKFNKYSSMVFVKTKAFESAKV